MTVTTFSYLTERSTIVGLFISLEILWIVADMASAIRKGYHNFESLELIVHQQCFTNSTKNVTRELLSLKIEQSKRKTKTKRGEIKIS